MNRPKACYRRCSNTTSTNSTIHEGGHYAQHQLSSTSPPLLQLAKQQRFDKIEEFLSISSQDRISAWLDAGSFPGAVSMGLQAFKGETILHLIMVYQPTVEVVDLLIAAMIKKDPRVVPEAVTDIQGRTPLTVAVIHNCDVSVVRRLLNGVTAIVPAVTKDTWQRLPLHWACTHESIVVKTNWSIKAVACTGKAKVSDNMIKVIETLLKAYPYAAVVKDVAAMTPLDLAIKEHVDPYVQQIVRFAWESFQPKEDKSKANTTEVSENSDLPFEEFAAFCDDDDDFDDLSSIGTGGVSRIKNRGPQRRQSHHPAVMVRRKLVMESTNL